MIGWEWLQRVQDIFATFDVSHYRPKERPNMVRVVDEKTKQCRKCLKMLERVKGIEPSYSAWKAAALPLSYTRIVSDLTWPGAGLNSPARCKFPCFGLRFSGSALRAAPE